MAKEKKKRAKAPAKKQKPALKVKIKRRVLPKMKVEERYAPKDLEDLLIRDLITGFEAYPELRLFLPTLIYNSTESMKELSYNYGFSIGKELFLKSGKDGIDPLLKLLENSGIGRTLYMPVIDTAVIKSSTKVPHEINAMNNLHSYEAGIISGYLSGHTSGTILTIETHCMYNGAPFCQFVSNPGDFRPTNTYKFTLDQTLSTMIDSIRISETRMGGKAQSYMMLCLLPILKKPLLYESSKLMFLAGKRYSESARNEDFRQSLKKFASFFDIQDMKIKASRKEVSVALKYNTYNSMEGFIELSTKAFIGFLSKHFNSVVKLKEGKFNNNYAITLSVTNGA